MDIPSSCNANDEQQIRLHFDGNCSLSPDPLKVLQWRMSQPAKQHHEFSSSARTIQALQFATELPISLSGPAIYHSQHPFNIPSISGSLVNYLTDAVFRSHGDLQELSMLKQQWTEGALLHRALALLKNDECQSLAQLQQAGFMNTTSLQESSGSPVASLPSSSCWQAEVMCVSPDSVVPSNPQGPGDSVVASLLHSHDGRNAPSESTGSTSSAFCMSDENDGEQSGPPKHSIMARPRKDPLKTAKEEKKLRLSSKRLQNVRRIERRRYNALSFAQKLFHLVTDQERAGNTHIVEFLDGGGGFWLRQSEAISELMPKYNFRGSKYSGFRRQLYSYGFKREKDGPFKGAFVNPLFSRGDPELCKQIKRDNRHDFHSCDLDSDYESDKSDSEEVIGHEGSF